MKLSGSKGRICTLSEYVQTQESSRKVSERIKVDRTKNFFQQRKEKCISIYKKKKYRKGLEI